MVGASDTLWILLKLWVLVYNSKIVTGVLLYGVGFLYNVVPEVARCGEPPVCVTAAALCRVRACVYIIIIISQNTRYVVGSNELSYIVDGVE